MRMEFRMRITTSMATVFLLVVFAGCVGRDGPERVIVSGTVTFNGKPIPNGKISFVPDPSINAPIAVAMITDGKYLADGHGGVPIGIHKVQIEAYYPVGQATPGAVLPPTVGVQGVGSQYLPARYNAKTSLQFTVESGKRELTQDFDLTD